VTTVREAPEPFAAVAVSVAATVAVAVKAECRVATTYSRRHIDLQRVAASLCPTPAPAHAPAAVRHTAR
jgi:hypothetical protein